MRTFENAYVTHTLYRSCLSNILQERGLTAPPIVVSSLLQTPEMKAIKAAGGMVGDKECIELLLEELLDEKYSTGVIVDGIPRTKVQADFVMKLNDSMLTAHRLDPKNFSRPIFRMCVLYVEGAEAVRRQLYRGKQSAEHNAKVKAEGKGELEEERPTDFDARLAQKRYEVFEEQTYSALQELGKHFIYNFINVSIETTPPPATTHHLLPRTPCGMVYDP